MLLLVQVLEACDGCVALMKQTNPFGAKLFTRYEYAIGSDDTNAKAAQGHQNFCRIFWVSLETVPTSKDASSCVINGAADRKQLQ